MKRLAMAASVLGLAAGVYFSLLHTGQAQNPGPAPVAQFRNPFEAAPVALPPITRPAPAEPVAKTTPSEFWNSSTAQASLHEPASQYGEFVAMIRQIPDAAREAVPLAASFKNLELNRDIEVHNKLGAWMIFVHAYKGDNAPMMAREMVAELRGPAYKLPAYVYNYGEKELKTEHDRVRKLIDDQKRELQKQGLQADLPIKVRYFPQALHCGVFIDGYATEEQAKKDLLGRIRKLEIPDSKKVKLDEGFFSYAANTFNKADDKFKADVSFRGKIKEDSRGYLNPFHKAFVCRNPSLPHLTAAVKQTNELDPKVLRSLNRDEPFSLLKNTKKFTLLVRHYVTPQVVHTKEESKSMMEFLGLHRRDEVDFSALNAHKLAECLRQAKLEAYVLHTQFNSYVTVGSYDSVDDPNLKEMQELLERRLNIPGAGLLPRPLAFKVPSDR